MKFPTPTRQEHEKFCNTEGWVQVRTARGRKGSHHITYELVLPDGRILRTRISHPPDRTDIGRGLFKHILRDQLQVSEDEFWACVKEGSLPDRGYTEYSDNPIPVEVVHLLTTRVGLSNDEVRQMSKREAIERLNRFWAEGG